MSMEPLHLGKYELRDRLAQGGQGEVWKAFDTQLRRYVAIKRLHANVQSDPDFTSHFEHEAQFVASLHHPNIVQIHDFQLVSHTDSQTTTAYMVMDYIEGPTLADYIRNTSRKGHFPTATDIVYIFSAVSLAIDYAHTKGMIHRDIKPANIILDQRFPRKNSIGTPILTDFGIAKLQGVSADTVSALGTPLYVSPEQAQSLPCDKQSDLYSFGIILYEMTTGVTPFRGDSYMAILMKHLQEQPAAPELINPNIPPALSKVILKSIAKSPHERFNSASAMTVAIAESLDVPVPVELLKSRATAEINQASSPYNPLQPSQAVPMTPSPFLPIAFQTPTLPMNAPSSASSSAINEFQTFAMTPVESRPGNILLPTPGANSPTSSTPQPSFKSPPRVVIPPVSPAKESPVRKRGISIILLALLLVVIVGSGLVFALRRIATPSTTPSNMVVGQVRFLSSPNAPRGSIDEAQITMKSIPNAPAGEQYYAWLQINNENILPIHWPLLTNNGRLSSPSYQDPSLLVNKPYLFLITVEKANSNPQIANLTTQARLYYAILPTSIQKLAIFDIRSCPQSVTNNICTS